MAWVTNIIFLCLFYLFKCDCVINHKTLEEAWDKKLHNDLKANYNWYQNPYSCIIIEVEMKFTMSSFIMDNDNDIFTVYGIMSSSWTDKRLKWNARNYGGITKTYFSKLAFWVPFVELSNGQDEEYWKYFDQCRIEDTGRVVCILGTEYSVKCATKISNWPYDTQKCTLEYRISKIQKNVHLLPRGKRAVSNWGEAYLGPEFTIVGYHQKLNTSDEVQLTITFVLDRNGEALAAIIIFPSIVLSILTASSIILDVNDRNRTLMILFSMFCHCFYLLEIGWEIPKQSADPPTIMLFYRSSVIMTLFLIVATTLLGKLRNKKSPPYPWVSSVYSTVLNSHGKYFIWPRWKTNIEFFTSEEVDVKDVDVWNGFANIVNSACFFVTIVFYSIMINECLPKQHAYTYEADNSSVFFAKNNY